MESFLIAAVYIRKSREEKDKPAYRLEVQRRELPEHARRSGWETLIFDDGYASAAKGKVENLPERGKLIDAIRAGRVNVVLTIELSRLSRDDTLQDYVGFLALCSQYSVKLATPSRVLDPAQNSDWMLLLLEGGFSSVEMKMLKARMEEGRADAYQRGAWLGGTPPAPYVLGPSGLLVIDPEQQKHVLAILNALTTKSAQVVAKEFAEPYANVRRFASDARLDFYLARRPSVQTPDEWVDCNWPPLIDADLASRIREARKGRNCRGGNSTRPTRLLTGLGIFRCGYCGHSAKSWQTKPKDKPAREYYYCSLSTDRSGCHLAKMAPRKPLEEMVERALLKALADPVKLAEWTLKEAEERGDQAAIADLNKQKKDLVERKARILRAIESDTVELADVKDRLAETKRSIEDTDRRIGELALLATSGPDLVHLAEIPALWADATLAERRDLLAAAVETIKLYRARLEITFKFPVNRSLNRQIIVEFPNFRALGGRCRGKY